EEGGVAEGEDAAVGGDEPVAPAGPRGRHGHDGLVERLAPHRPVEGGGAEGEDAAVGGDHPVAAPVGCGGHAGHRLGQRDGAGGDGPEPRGDAVRLPMERTTGVAVTPPPRGRTRCYQSGRCYYCDGGFWASSPSWRILRRFSHCSVRNTSRGTRTKSISSQPP